MKTTLLLTLFLLAPALVGAQEIDKLLREIERNNQELQANNQLAASQKLAIGSGNNLPDPAISYAHLWDARQGSRTTSEMEITQRFDFPTTYLLRGKSNKLQLNVVDAQADALRQQILLQAQELCLDLILLRQEKNILHQRLQAVMQLSDLYEQRLQSGDANIIETNKIKLELLNVKTEAALNETSLQRSLQALQALNGNQPTEFTATDYPPVALPADYETFQAEAISRDPSLRALQQESEAARRQVAVIRSGWLPKFELGYRRDVEDKNPFNGAVVGISIPLFENRGKVKAAKAQLLSRELTQRSAQLQIHSTLEQDYREAQQLAQAIREYKESFRLQTDLDLLQQAVTGGEISLIEYFAEANLLYQTQRNYLKLQHQQQKALARLYKNRL
jgi:outer membrane protein TolC